jgi:hypothetical protein
MFQLIIATILQNIAARNDGQTLDLHSSTRLLNVLEYLGCVCHSISGKLDQD